jgi:ectoine hydroxylase-related dioxygenase (phytanoyl-CoA dioxygenase family)
MTSIPSGVAAVDPALLPTDEEVEAYVRTGYHVSRRIVPDEVLDAAEEGMARFYAGDHDAPFPGRTAYDHTDWTPAAGPGLRKNDYTSLMVRQLGDLVRWPAISAVAARLSGAAGIRLWADQLLWKPPGVADGTANVGWHTDRQYWQSCTSTAMLTAWVPFHDCDARTGGMTLVEGSHLWDQPRLDFFDGDLEGLERRFASGGRPVVKFSAVLPRGSVSFHHCRVVHGSGPNRSDAPRRSMAIHFQPADNRYQPVGEDGEPTYHRNDELVRRVDGVPDYTDPRICPLLFGQDA